MKKDRGEPGSTEYTKECALGGKCVLGISGWMSSCLSVGQTLGVRSRMETWRREEKAGPAGHWGRWGTVGGIFPPVPASSSSTAGTGAGHGGGAGRLGGVPSKAGPEAVDGKETGRGVADPGREARVQGRGQGVTGWGQEGGTWGPRSEISGQRLTKVSPLLLPVH